MSKIPMWVTSPPGNNQIYSTFITVGLSAGGDEDAAYTDAKNKALNELDKRLRLSVEQNTSLEARNAYNSFKSRLLSMLSASDSNSSGIVRIKDSFSESDTDGLKVYLLVEYNNSKFSAERERLETLFEKQDKILTAKERQGAIYSDGGFYYKAALSYIGSALEVASVTDDSAEMSFERNITKAVDCIKKIQFQAVSGPETAYIGESLSEGYVVKILSGEKGVENLPVEVSYKVLQGSGRKTTETSRVISDVNGIASFKPQVPGWVGTEKVTFCLDLSSSLQSLENVSFALLQYVDELNQAVSSCCVSFDLTVQSRAVEIPTCVMIMDVDRSGNPLSRADTASAVTEELDEAGFDVSQLSVDYRMTAMTDSELIAMIREQYGSMYDRLVFGTSEISSFEESETSVIVKVTGKLKVVDLDTGKILFSASEQKRARGRNKTAIISAAFTSLGKLFGERLLTDLP